MADKEEQKRIEEAKKLLIAENDKKIKACAEEVNAVLNKHGFTIVSGQPTLQLK